MLARKRLFLPVRAVSSARVSPHTQPICVPYVKAFVRLCLVVVSVGSGLKGSTRQFAHDPAVAVLIQRQRTLVCQSSAKDVDVVIGMGGSVSQLEQ
eukprot:2377565-Pleurochrysis_carterae.AAC.2